MSKKDGAKDFEFDLDTEFVGYDSARDKTNIGSALMVRGSQNVYKKISGTYAVRQGQKRQGVVNTVQSAISSSFVWNTSWGAVYTLVIADSKLSVVIDEVWYTLLSSLTATRYVFDKWWDNTEKKDRALFVNGSDNIFHWSGGFATVLSSTLNTITKTGSTSWQQAGFASNTAGEKKIMIDGVEFTYTGGESTTTLTGVTPSALSIVVGATALQSVQTTTDKPAANFANDFLKVINNQVYIGSYTSRLIYISDDTDFTNYTVPVPRAPGDPELITLDATGKGIGVRRGNAHIGFGTGGWAVISFSDITVGSTLTQQTRVDISPVTHLGAPYAHEFIDVVGDTLIYLAQDQQVRTFGDFTNLYAPAYPSISQNINTELTEQTFTGGTLKCIGDFTYLSAPLEGRTWLYQVREGVGPNGEIINERLWHSPFIWNLTKVDEISGVIVGFSNANPQIYELWDTDQWYDDSPADEQLPYECILAFGYESKGRREGLISFDKVFSEGYISIGTPLSLRVNYNYEGSLAVVEVPINSNQRPAYLFAGTSPASLGDSSIGDEPLGQGTEDNNGQNNLAKYKVINSLAKQDCFEYQLQYFSNAANAQWEVLAKGTNAELSDNQANFIINKLRN